MIHTSNLSFRYDERTSFDFPDITLDDGQTLLVTGNSGKGKTTLLHLLGGLLKPKDGQITINTTNMVALNGMQLDRFRGQNIGMILQKSYFAEALTIIENVELAAWLASGRKSATHCRYLLDELGLADQMEKLPSELSVGQQQRASIARALVNNPKLVLADEPTSSVDDANAFIVAELLEGLTKSYGASLVIVTHDQRLKNKFINQIDLQ